MKDVSRQKEQQVQWKFGGGNKKSKFKEAKVSRTKSKRESPGEGAGEVTGVGDRLYRA